MRFPSDFISIKYAYNSTYVSSKSIRKIFLEYSLIYSHKSFHMGLKNLSHSFGRISIDSSFYSTLYIAETSYPFFDFFELLVLLNSLNNHD